MCPRTPAIWLQWLPALGFSEYLFWRWLSTAGGGNTGGRAIPSDVGAPPLCRQNSARKQSSILHWPAASQGFIFVYCLTSKILKNFVSCLALGNYRRLLWEEAQGERLVFPRRNTKRADFLETNRSLYTMLCGFPLV